MMWLAIIAVLFFILWMVRNGLKPTGDESKQGAVSLGVQRRLYFDVVGTQLEGGVPNRVITPSLAATEYGVADDGLPIPIPGSIYEKIGETFDDRFERGLAQLRGEPFEPAKTAQGFWSLAAPNASARLLCDEAIAKLEVKGTHVVMVPDRDLLLVAGSDDDAGLAAMLETAEAQFGGTEYRSLVASQLDEEGEWFDWLPAAGHALHARFLGAANLTRVRDFDDLRKSMKVPCAHVAVLPASAGGALVSSWVKGTEVLQPEFDRLVLIDPEAEGELHRTEVGYELFELVYAGERPAVGHGVWKTTRFPSEHERTFMRRHRGEQKGEPSEAELRAAAGRVGELVLMPRGTLHGDVGFEAHLVDGRSRTIDEALAESLADALPDEDSEAFEDRWVAAQGTAYVLAAAKSAALGEAEKAAHLLLQSRLYEGHRKFAAGQLEEARAIFAEFVEDGAQAVRVSLAAALLELKDLEGASREYETVLEADPNDAEALLGRGRLRYRSGDIERAKRDWKVLTEVAPDSNEADEARELLEDPTGAAAAVDDARDALLAEAGPRAALMPVLRPRGYRQGLTLSQVAIGAVNGLDTSKFIAPEPMTFPLADGIEIELVYDMGETMTPVWAQHAAGNLAHELKRTAMANLEVASSRPFAELAPGVWRGLWADGFSASRLLLPGVSRALAKGPLVALTSTYDTFIVVRADDEVALAKAIAVAGEAPIRDQYGYREALTATPWILGETGWTPWTSPPASVVPAIAALAKVLETARERSLVGLQQFAQQPAARA